ncbi:hypothetical protein E4T50_07304 [Aureobasidium sp. EXF-12298]|nr:hypothetical protein E4T50_07304 [Aureobasidium sp. EXF-12298]KAI4763703.1 hypothetical protein E4T51_03252 [Aureobasidium sp. EXF-12344]KAI4769275.1 hypothetical protein E4T52_15672 [Aureobasidium sp. EXF-3400]
MATLTQERIEPYEVISCVPHSKPVLVNQRPTYDRHVFAERPLLSALLFDNVDSDARDHCANERSMSTRTSIRWRGTSQGLTNVRYLLAFLSWLRLAIYMAVVSVAILISFHLKNQPSPLERKIALPFGIIFWFLALACLASGTANYIKTVEKYSKRRALVQTGWKTQLVFTIVATSIVAACVLFLSTNAGAKQRTR